MGCRICIFCGRTGTCGAVVKRADLTGISSEKEVPENGGGKEMAIKSGRTDGVAKVNIDYNACSGCRLCLKVCKGAPLKWDGSRVVVDQTVGFGCYGCGHCMAVCPEAAITIDGRCISPEDVFDQSSAAVPADYKQLFELMLKRRSIRNFTKKEISPEIIEQIVSAVATAPMGIPPSEVGIVVMNGREKVAAFGKDIIAAIRRMKWQISKPMVYMMRPFMGKDAFDAFVSFVPALFEALDQGERHGEDLLFYNAPLAMVFHTSAFADPVDSYIAATYAMLAAEAIGLGSCMIGSVAPVLKNNRRLKEKYKIPPNNQPGLVVIFGYPDVKYRRVLKRSLASVQYI